MDFEEAYAQFVLQHLESSTVSRARRLQDGLGHAEKLFLLNVWWPIFGHFHHLHPEYEIRDYSDGHRYIDFAYIQAYYRLAIEIDGFEWHWQGVTRQKHADHVNRQNALLIDDWRLLRFTYDSVLRHPRSCQQTVQQMLGKGQIIAAELAGLSLEEREIVRIAARRSLPISAPEICDWIHVSSRHARELLHRLVESHWLEPASGSVRITSYRIDSSRLTVPW